MPHTIRSTAPRAVKPSCDTRWRASGGWTRDRQCGHLQQHPVRRADSRRLATNVAGASRRRLLPQPAGYKVMEKQNYGRFVFISSSAGKFGQPMEAHYAAAKTGLVGLTNVIAIEGEAHGILSNTVLPTGFSRMVTETRGRREVPRTSRASCAPSGPNSSCHWWSTWPVGPASSPIATTRRAPAATPGCSSVSARAGWRSRGTEPTVEDVAAHLADNFGDRAVHGPRVDIRGGLRRVGTAGCRPHLSRPPRTRATVGAHGADIAILW